MRKSAKAAAIAAALLVTALPVLHAAPFDSGVREGEAVVTELANHVSAVTYWISRPDGWHVVTTVDTVTNRDRDDENHAIVRFSSLLQPNQSQEVSIALPAGEQQQVLRISRIADRIELELVPALGM